jgi:FkbM family methyltransferase
MFLAKSVSILKIQIALFNAPSQSPTAASLLSTLMLLMRLLFCTVLLCITSIISANVATPPLQFLQPTPHQVISIPHPLRRGVLEFSVVARPISEEFPFTEMCIQIFFHASNSSGYTSKLSCLSVEAALQAAPLYLHIDSILPGNSTFVIQYFSALGSAADGPREKIPFFAQKGAAPSEDDRVSFDAAICQSQQREHYDLPMRGGVFGEDATHAFYSWLSNHVEPSSDCLNVVDVGANVGANLLTMQSLLANRTQCPGILMFEPNPAVYATLLARVANETRGVIALPYAISDRDAVMPFHAAQNDSAFEWGGLERAEYPFQIGIPMNEVLVPTRRLDSIMATLMPNASIELLKIDTEGHDLPVLQGATETLQRTKYVVFECSNLWDASNRTVHEAVNLLSSLGFRTYLLGYDIAFRLDGELWHHDFEAHKQWANCLALRAADVLTAQFESEHLFPRCVAPLTN